MLLVRERKKDGLTLPLKQRLDVLALVHLIALNVAKLILQIFMLIKREIEPTKSVANVIKLSAKTVGILDHRLIGGRPEITNITSQKNFLLTYIKNKAVSVQSAKISPRQRETCMLTIAIKPAQFVAYYAMAAIQELGLFATTPKLLQMHSVI